MQVRSGLRRLLLGEERLCLVRNPVGIFPLLLSSLSPVGATLEFKRTIDGGNFTPGQCVVLIGVDKRFEHLLCNTTASVVWLDVSFMGVALDTPLRVTPDDLRRELGA